MPFWSHIPPKLRKEAEKVGKARTESIQPGGQRAAGGYHLLKTQAHEIMKDITHTLPRFVGSLRAPSREPSTVQHSVLDRSPSLS